MGLFRRKIKAEALIMGCAAVVGAVFSFVTIVPLLFVPNLTLGERIMIAAMGFGMAFVASLILFYKDRVAYRRANGRVKR